MTPSIIGFVAGLLWLQYLPALPDVRLQGGLLAAGLLLSGAVCLTRRRHAWRMLLLCGLGCACGVLWGSWRAEIRLASALPAVLEGEDVTLIGTIAAMPQRTERGWRFEFAVESPAEVPRRISLAWYEMGMRSDGPDLHVPPLHAGDRWQLTARLKRPHGNLNPYGFDYEGWLFERGVRATGYVRPRSEHRLLESAASAYVVERARESVRSRFERTLSWSQSEAPYAGVLLSLIHI